MGPRAVERQVSIFLRWAYWLFNAVLVGRAHVVLNMDESPVERCIPRRRGWVVSEAHTGRCALHEGIATRESRSHVTLVAVIADMPALQPALPQTLIARDRGINRHEKGLLQHAVRPLSWLPGQNGWVTATNVGVVLARIRRAVREAIGECEVVLAWDCATQHLSEAALRSLTEEGFVPLLIPAGLTWLLQPLDTHVFADFKRGMHRLQAATRANAAGGALPAGYWIHCIEACVRDFFGRQDYATSFARNGLASSQDNLRPCIRQLVRDQPTRAARAPSQEELEQLVGRPGRMLEGPLLARARALQAERARRPAVPPVLEAAPPAGAAAGERPGAPAGRHGLRRRRLALR